MENSLLATTSSRLDTSWSPSSDSHISRVASHPCRHAGCSVGHLLNPPSRPPHPVESLMREPKATLAHPAAALTPSAIHPSSPPLWPLTLPGSAPNSLAKGFCAYRSLYLECSSLSTQKRLTPSLHLNLCLNVSFSLLPSLHPEQYLTHVEDSQKHF